MAVTPDKAAPYAPTSTVLDVITRYRDRGLPVPVTKEVLLRASVPDSLIPRVLQSLQALDLIDDAGQPTATFEGIRRAPEAEYKQRLKEWLDGAYADALNYVDPTTADEVQVRDAFRNYNPVGQQGRMVSLFMGLYSAAGIGPEKANVPRSPRPQRIAATPRQAARAPALSAGLKAALATKVGRPMQQGTNLPEPLMGMLTRLPSNGVGWTQAERDKFMSTFGTVLDFCFPIVPETPATNAKIHAEVEEM